VPARPRHVATWSGSSGRWDIAAHRAGRHTLIEFEPAPADRPDVATVLAELQHAGEQIDAAIDVQAVCGICVQEIRRLSGFDRVWVHRFNGEGEAELMASSGVASAADPGAPWLPRPHAGSQCHAVPDVGYVPAPLFPERPDDDLDTRRCILQGMAQASRSHLARMGIAASLSLPIVVRNRTWGMVTCHHSSPRPAPSPMRACCERVIHMSALRIEACEQAALAECARERSMLVVQEAHHRVQNSLQIVASTLRLQARQAEDARTRSQLEAAAVRLTAISAAHRQLSRLDDNRGVQLERHLEHLCRDLAASWGEDWAGQLIVDACRATLTADAAVGLGLVVAELLTNAVKYAYGGEPGPISVCATRDAQWLQLTVSDRGHGMQRGVDGSGLGSRLTRAFAAQLGGDIELSSGDQGTTATLRVPLSSIRTPGDSGEPIALVDEG
jgi:two-component sensor histidine kinase